MGGVMRLLGRFINVRQSLRGLGLAGILMACGAGAGADESKSPPASADPVEHPVAHPGGPVHEPVVAHPVLDRSGNKRLGKASFYAREFSGRKMADGTIMEPQSNNAASKTLPLGTVAKVTNLETGRSAVVTIRDRGPYIRGRIVDLSPATAKEIGIEHKNGVAKVEVAPLAVPLPDGHIKLGAAVETNADRELMSAQSPDNFAHLADADLPDLIKIYTAH
jgi:rare lipoprotein A